MSAVNVFVQDDAAHVFTDGAAYDASGAVQGIISKVAVLPHFNGAIAATGIPGTKMLSEGVFADTNLLNFDQAKLEFANRIRAAHKAFPTAWGQGPFEVFFVGWSQEKDQPQAFLLRSYSDGVQKAFDARAVRKFSSPCNADVTTFQFEPTDAAASGLKLIELQRRSKFLPGGKRIEMHAVGGFCQHTIIRRDRVETSMLRRWPDKIGEPIAV